MIKKLKEQYNENEEGFTLIELMIVVVIIGILAAIAIPIFANQQKAAQEATLKSDIKSLALNLQTSQTKTGKINFNFKTPISRPDLYSTGINSNFLVCFDDTSYAIFAKIPEADGYWSLNSKTGKLAEQPTGGIDSYAVRCPGAGFPNNTANASWGYSSTTTAVNNGWNYWVSYP